MRPAPSASESVGGRSWTISRSTFTCWVYETTFPVKTCFIVSRYWS
jgi:hypothetical protein